MCCFLCKILVDKIEKVAAFLEPTVVERINSRV